MKRQPDLSLILACYNEASHFAQSIREIEAALKRSIYTWEIIFVEDKSTDVTAQMVLSWSKKHPNCQVIFHPRNWGRGRSVADGIRAAKGTVVGYIDIDCEVSPVYIPEMVGKILSHKADVVIGKRIYRTSFSSLSREIFSLGYQWLANRILGTGGLDTETGYKFFRRVKILPVLRKTKHPGWFWDTEITVRAKRAGLRIVEVPVLFLRKGDKQSTVRPLRDITNYLVSLYRFRKQL